MKARFGRSFRVPRLNAAMLAAVMGLAPRPARTPPEIPRASGATGIAPTGRQTAEDLDVSARREMGQGRVDRAIELLSEAVAHDPDNGAILADLTLAYLRHGDREFAEFYLNLAVRSGNRVPPSPEALSVLGDVYASDNRLDDAIIAWEAAWRFGSRDVALRVKVNRARTELALSHGQRFYGGDHFEIYYDAALSEPFVAGVDALLERDRVAQADFFAVAPVENQLVILYASRRVFDALDAPDWAAGFFDGKIRVPVAAERGLDEALDGLLAHELAHAYFSAIAPGRVPAWLQEGVAQYLEGRRLDPAQIRAAVLRGSRPKLSELDRDFRQRTDRAAALRAYRLSLSAVEFLIARSGEGAVSCLVQDLAAGSNASAAFPEAFSADEASLEREWLASIGGETTKSGVR